MGGGTSKPKKGIFYGVNLTILLLMKQLVDAKKFHQAYMLTRELGSGAFSVVKLGIHHVS